MLNHLKFNCFLCDSYVIICRNIFDAYLKKYQILCDGYVIYNWNLKVENENLLSILNQIQLKQI